MRSNKLATWSRLQAVVWTPALVWAALSAGAAGSVVYVGLAVALSVASLSLVLSAPRTLADGVTLLRAGVVAVALACPAWIAPGVWGPWSLLAGAAAMDLVDGAIARRYGGTDNGAVLDMETDQLTVLALAWLVVARGGAPHVLLLPMMRYAFVLAAWWAALPANDPKPVEGDNRRGRLVCAVVVVCLLTALAPIVPTGAGDLLTGIAVLLLIWSFAGDWAFLFAHRREEARP